MKTKKEEFDLSKKIRYLMSRGHYLRLTDLKEFIKIIQEDMKGLKGEEALKLIIKKRAGDKLAGGGDENLLT